MRHFQRSCLPGVVTASGDDDPSAISTYSVAGATTGLAYLWLILISTPLLIAVHRMSARLGDTAQKGLMALVNDKFGRRAAFACVLIFIFGNFFALVADILGMAAGFQLLTGQHYIYFIIPLIILVWYVIVFDTYRHIIKYLFWFSGILIAYVLAGISVELDWPKILKSIVLPDIRYNMTYILGGLGLLGAIFSPYTFIWQTEEEIEENHNTSNIKQANKGVVWGFVYSNLIAFFIIIASANIISDGQSVNLLTAKDIAQALAPVAGKWATKLFGLGLIGAGILAVPIIATSSAYAVAQFFNWPGGLNEKPGKAKGFYGIITFGFLCCLAALFLDLNPIKTMFYSQILVGALTPVIIYFILNLAADRKITRNHPCGRLEFIGGWVTIGLLIAGDALFFWLCLR